MNTRLLRERRGGRVRTAFLDGLRVDERRPTLHDGAQVHDFLVHVEREREQLPMNVVERFTDRVEAVATGSRRYPRSP